MNAPECPHATENGMRGRRHCGKGRGNAGIVAVRFCINACPDVPRPTPPLTTLTVSAAPPPPPAAVPREQWPRTCKAIAKLAQPADRGIGDTLDRITAKGGGRQFKRFYKRITGRNCGCDDRQAWLNALYPLG